MMEDTLAIEEDEEVEEEADAEVDKVLFDLTNGKLGQTGTIQNQEPVRSTHCSPCILAFDVLFSESRRQAGRRRDRKSHGAVPATAQWLAQLIIFTPLSL